MKRLKLTKKEEVPDFISEGGVFLNLLNNWLSEKYFESGMSLMIYSVNTERSKEIAKWLEGHPILVESDYIRDNFPNGFEIEFVEKDEANNLTTLFRITYKKHDSDGEEILHAELMHKIDLWIENSFWKPESPSFIESVLEISQKELESAGKDIEWVMNYCAEAMRKKSDLYTISGRDKVRHRNLEKKLRWINWQKETVFANGMFLPGQNKKDFIKEEKASLGEKIRRQKRSREFLSRKFFRSSREENGEKVYRIKFWNISDFLDFAPSQPKGKEATEPETGDNQVQATELNDQLENEQERKLHKGISNLLKSSHRILFISDFCDEENLKIYGKQDMVTFLQDWVVTGISDWENISEGIIEEIWEVLDKLRDARILEQRFLGKHL